MTSWTGLVSTITLVVEDLALARRFCTEAFGVPVVFEDPQSAVVRVGGRAHRELCRSRRARLGGRPVTDTAWQTHPATPDRFEDFADVLNPNRRQEHCWCLHHRLPAGEVSALGGGRRTDAKASRMPRLAMRRVLAPQQE